MEGYHNAHFFQLSECVLCIALFSSNLLFPYRDEIYCIITGKMVFIITVHKYKVQDFWWVIPDPNDKNNMFSAA
jgi:phosphate starvation-inducible membrane PsiE